MLDPQDLGDLGSPTAYLQDRLGDLAAAAPLRDYEAWWETEGRAISEATDRAGARKARRRGRTRG